VTRGRKAWQLPRAQRDWGAQRLITIILLSVSSSVYEIYSCATSSHRRKTDGQILFLDSCPSSSEYDIATIINFSDVIDEFASVKARKVIL
jgi:hypothetical protein